jgi:hypothetical protein
MAKQFKFDPTTTYTIAALRKAIGQKEIPKAAAPAARSYHRTLRFVASPANFALGLSAMTGPRLAEGAMIRPGITAGEATNLSVR